MDERIDPGRYEEDGKGLDGVFPPQPALHGVYERPDRARNKKDAAI